MSVECDGDCYYPGEDRYHEGEVRRVRVSKDGHPNSPWEFNYYRAAVLEDERRGYTVVDLGPGKEWV